MRAGSSLEEEDSNCVIFRLKSLDVQATTCCLAIVILRALAVLDFLDVEDEEDDFLSVRLSSRFFLKGAGEITAAFSPFIHVLEVADMAGVGRT
jgi:hypothetical protein